MISIFELFSIGIGPSSSHTVGPMRAANRFVAHLKASHLYSACQRVQVELYGSLALTGKGHGTHTATIVGLEGHEPETVDPDYVFSRYDEIGQQKQLYLCEQKTIRFDLSTDLVFHMARSLPQHANALTFTAFNNAKEVILKETYFSIGGGFIADEAQISLGENTIDSRVILPFEFNTARKLLEFCKQEQKNIAELMLQNELVWHNLDTITAKANMIWQVMDSCIERGLKTEGILPGGLLVKRRAPGLYKKLQENPKPHFGDMRGVTWLNAFAMAVNEENAAGGRVVTAPTNGAAGIIPAVLKYYLTFHENAQVEDVLPFLLTAGAIGLLYKLQASISGAEMGCQGEVGVACSMAAAALTAVLGGTPLQVENAAEIGMEHHLGLTCDPMNGLVQIPCIERNAMAAVKAVNIAQLVLFEEGEHKVSLDKVIATMRATGRDMLSIYKETSKGGLAVNHPEC
jgi:L-serine dehydratase